MCKCLNIVKNTYYYESAVKNNESEIEHEIKKSFKKIIKGNSPDIAVSYWTDHEETGTFSNIHLRNLNYINKIQQKTCRK